MTDEHAVGSVADELAKLLSAAQDWGAGPTAEGLRDLGRHVGHGEDCTLCPLCRLIRRVRSTEPEVLEHLASALASLVRAGAALVAAGNAGAAEPGTGEDCRPRSPQPEA